MESEETDAAEYDPFDDAEFMEEAMAIPSQTFNYGFIPEELAFWRRWRKTADT